MTTRAPWPGRAPSRSGSCNSSTAEPDLVIVPVGGGGCIAGITTYLARADGQHRSARHPEPAGAAAMMAALAAGEPVTLDHVDQFVDGAAVNQPEH